MRARMVLLIACCLGAALGVRSSESAQLAPGRLSQSEALGIVREVNTAEVEFSLKNQPFAALEDVLSRLQGQGADLGAVSAERGSARIKDHLLSVVVSGDGRHYRLELIPLEGARCAPALFSNDTGVIYTARPLGCAQTAIWDDTRSAQPK